jgi:predicted outer membrane repeat protein
VINSDRKIRRRSIGAHPIIKFAGAIAVVGAATLAPVALAAALVPPSTAILYAYASGTNATSTSCPAAATGAPNSARCSISTALSDVLTDQIATIYLGDVGQAHAYGSSVSQGFVLNAPFSTVTISPAPGLTGNAVFDGGGSTGTGYSILSIIGNNESVSIKNVTFQNGYANKNHTGVGCNFSGSERCAGAISEHSNNGTLLVKGCVFTHNYSNWVGGAIDAADDAQTATLIVSNSTFTSNAAAASGGAISAGDNSGTGYLTIVGSTFVHNSALGFYGGAIDAGVAGGTATVHIATSAFVANLANNGGALDLGDGGTVTPTVISSTFDSNTSTGDGGAINVADGGVENSGVFFDLGFFNNTANGVASNSVTPQLHGGSGTFLIIASSILTPSATILSSTAAVSKGSISVVVSCATASCAGPAEITMVNAQKKTIVVATGSLNLLPGAKGFLTLTETPAGKLMLAKATPMMPFRLPLTMFVHGAKPVGKVIAIVS